MKYAIVTFGCRVNQADSLVIEDTLRTGGAVESSAAAADLVIVNTCSVTASADQGARQTIRRIVRENPSARVIVTGCYATRRPDEVGDLPNVRLVVPNECKDTFDWHSAAGADAALTTARRYGDGEGACGSALAPGIAGRTALTLRVQTGCEEQCSYCIIPRTRGRGRSRPLDAVVSDIRRAVAAGYKEIAITGVHLGSYGRELASDERGGISLATLIRVLCAWPDEVLFRISSLEPMDCSLEIVDLVASSPRLAPHFHLPLQHGANEILRAMRRPYSVAYYRALIRRIHDLMPHASIGSDIIVGFPGEQPQHFEEMCHVLRDLPLSHLHVFPYSDRPGTAAEALRPKVDGRDVRERARQVREIGARMSAAFRARHRGRRRRALVVDDGWSAVTDNYLKVRLDEHHERNTWIDALIDGQET
jgi:threonylcarbamoyladenosine tRNA methylthiotransferase MtaB